MAFYDCLKFVNEAFFSVLVIGISVLLASNNVITVGTVLTAYLCFTQLTGPLRELHRILDEFSESLVLAGDYFNMVDIPRDFSYDMDGRENKYPSSNDISINDVSFLNALIAISSSSAPRPYPRSPRRLLISIQCNSRTSHCHRSG